VTDAARASAKSTILRSSALAPFAVRSFRFLWPANIATSWAFEMETLILGWYVLVETKSVFLLTVFASLQWFGTLISPTAAEAAGPALASMLIYLLMAIVLALRPEGLFPAKGH